MKYEIPITNYKIRIATDRRYAVRRSGVTLFELMTAMAIVVIPIAAVGIFIIRNDKQWQELMQYINSPKYVDSQVIMEKFNQIGRRSYDAQVNADGSEVKFNLFLNSDYSLKDPRTIPGYARFYIDDDALKVDYGSSSPVLTETIAENVSFDSGVKAFEVSEYNKGYECVRINLKLTNPDDHNSIEIMTANGNNVNVMTAVLMRE
ncbi:MAG: hypothetical protein BWY69_00224 [Planctomycetes bacterium ADurb.Bin401]|jgi:hypothetical protein|nr:MAG: hypothetical protein BWY69_00224 [Planctomycetes bacterium ADurb.Bin401]